MYSILTSFTDKLIHGFIDVGFCLVILVYSSWYIHKDKTGYFFLEQYVG